MAETMRIAMWSGPRNISTAMMRSWGSRADTFVCDEPLYAHYLRQTGLPHPMRAEIIADQENDWRKVVAWLTGPVPDGRRIFYQKHMAQHLLDEIGREWLDDLTHCFLIREPREMLTSLLNKYERVTLADTGLPQQRELFRRVRDGRREPPPVLDARDVLENPRRLLGLLCERLGVAFDEAMLRWEPGRRATDGIWASHWYDAVETSTGFGPYRAKDEQVPPEHADLLAACDEIYAELHAERLC